MAIVARYQFDHGKSASINDECYANKTEAELEEARERARAIARRIHARKIMRDLGLKVEDYE